MYIGLAYHGQHSAGRTEGLGDGAWKGRRFVTRLEMNRPETTLEDTLDEALPDPGATWPRGTVIIRCFSLFDKKTRVFLYSF